MINTKFKLFYLLIPFLIFNPLLADESWYQTAANLHKEWAKTYHKVSDLERYTNKCYFKFGIYSNANQKAKHKHLAEGMTVFIDYMAMANTEEKLEEILLKDK